MKGFLIGIGCAVLTGGILRAQTNSTSSPPSESAPAQQSPQLRTSPRQMPATQATPVAPPNSRVGAASSQAGPVTRIAPGSVIPVSLTKTLDAKKAKVGDEVVAKVTEEMKSNSGQLIVAKDTKMMGRVTEAQPRTKQQIVRGDRVRPRRDEGWDVDVDADVDSGGDRTTE